MNESKYLETKGKWKGEADQDVKVYTAVPSLTAANPLNQIALLFGIADMGIRLTFTSTYKSFNDTDFMVGRKWYPI
jgi:hypothetical protein